MKKFLTFLFVLFIFNVFFISTVESQELTEEQKKQLQQAIQSQLEKFKQDIDKVNKMSEVQNQSQPKELSSSSISQKSPVLPKWDGIYAVNNNDDYIEMKFLTKASSKRVKSKLTGKEYVDVYVLPSEINYISFNDLKGFFIKGSKLLEKIKIFRAKMNTSFLSGITSFLSGMSGGQNFTIDENEIDNNLYVTKFRCSTEMNSQYCEFTESNEMRKYLLEQSNNKYCLLFLTGNSPEEGKAYVLCFK